MPHIVGWEDEIWHDGKIGRSNFSDLWFIHSRYSLCTDTALALIPKPWPTCLPGPVTPPPPLTGPFLLHEIPVDMRLGHRGPVHDGHGIGTAFGNSLFSLS